MNRPPSALVNVFAHRLQARKGCTPSQLVRPSIQTLIAPPPSVTPVTGRGDVIPGDVIPGDVIPGGGRAAAVGHAPHERLQPAFQSTHVSVTSVTPRRPENVGGPQGDLNTNTHCLVARLIRRSSQKGCSVHGRQKRPREAKASTDGPLQVAPSLPLA
jgi:hypothetical protein